MRQFIRAFGVIRRRGRKGDLSHWFGLRVAVSALAGLSPAQVAALQTYAIEDVTVIAMDRERKLERHTVIVRDGRIADVGPSARVRAPRDATRIDGRGKYLIPGLGDAHAHLSIGGGGPTLADRALTLFALNGVTMVRSAYTEPHHLASRDRVEQGTLIGPRTVIVSPPLAGRAAASPDAARNAVRQFAAEKYQAIKVMPGMSATTFDTMVAEARAVGAKLVGHVPPSVGLERVLDAGFASVEHLDGFLEALAPRGGEGPAADGGFFGFAVPNVDDGRIPALVAAVKRSGTTVVPTEHEMELFTSTDSGAALRGRPEMQYAPRGLVEQWVRQKDGFASAVGVTPERSVWYRDVRRRLIRELHSAGVPIALGSDAFNMFAVPGWGTFDELETLASAGLTPFAALTSATVRVAQLLGIPGVTGTIAVGGAADLVLLDADPLTDVANVRRQVGVMLRGRWMPREEIQRRLAELAGS